MNSVPRGVVAARRTAGVLLIVAGLVTVTGLIVLVGWWSSRPPTITTLPTGCCAPTAAVASGPTSTPGTVVPPADPGAQLQAQKDADSAAVAAIPDGAWVAQLSSKRVGLVAAGITYSNATILSDHQDLRGRYPDVALLWSGDFRTFKYPNFWVTIVTTPYSTADEANAWCDAQQLDADHCYAKRISATTSYTPNTKGR